MWKTASTTGIAVLRPIVTLSFPAPAQNGAVDSPRPRYEFAKSSACGKILCRRLRFLARRSGKTSCLHSLVRGSATRGCDECHKVSQRRRVRGLNALGSCNYVGGGRAIEIWLGGLDSNQRPRRTGRKKSRSGVRSVHGSRSSLARVSLAEKVGWEAWTRTSARGKRAGTKSRSGDREHSAGFSSVWPRRASR